MGIEITDADMDRLFAGSNEAEPEGSNEVQTEEAPVAETAADSTPESTPEPAPEPQVETVKEEEGGHAVPYSRFSKVIAARNDAQEKLTGYEERLSSLQQELEEAKRFRSYMDQMQPKQTAQPAVEEAEEEWIDPAVRSQLQAMQQRLQHFEYNTQVERETQNVMKEVGTARQAHPDVPEEAFYEALNRDPHADLNAFGSMYTQRIAEIEEAAIARHMASQKVAPDVPPEVGSQTGKRSSEQADNKNQSWEDSLDKLFGLT
jgi:hypothetical protein